MINDLWEVVWERLRSGRPAVVIGLRLPLLVTVHGRPQGSVAALIDVMRQAYGDAVVLESASEARASEGSAPLIGGGPAPGHPACAESRSCLRRGV